MRKRYQPIHLNKEKKRRRFPVTAIISYMLIAVVLTTGVSFSSYSSNASGTAAAQIAKWSVTADGQTGQIFDVAENMSGTYAFTVSNDSEVSMEYDVVVTVPEGTTNNITFKLDDSNAAPAVQGNTYTFANAGQISIGGNENSHTLKITAERNMDRVTISGITVEIVARQVD